MSRGAWGFFLIWLLVVDATAVKRVVIADHVVLVTPVTGSLPDFIAGCLVKMGVGVNAAAGHGLNERGNTILPVISAIAKPSGGGGFQFRIRRNG